MDCQPHSAHSHKHGAGCGHQQVLHDGHKDALHDGHLHHSHGDHVDDHRLMITKANPDACTKGHDCAAHAAGHAHGPTCGHPAVPHGNHTDYWVAGHLHQAHTGHCDSHGQLAKA
jgi:hypothetical protein